MLNRFGIPMCQPKGGKQCVPENTGPMFKVGDIVQIIKASNSEYKQEIGRYGPIKGIEEGLLSTLYSVALYIGTPHAGVMTTVNENDLALFNIQQPLIKPPPPIQMQSMQQNMQPPPPPNMVMHFSPPPPPQPVQHETEYKVCLYESSANRQSYSCEYYDASEQNQILKAYKNRESLSIFKNNWEKGGKLERHTFNFVYDDNMPHNKQYTLIKVPK